MGRARCLCFAAAAASGMLVAGCVGGSATSVGGHRPLAGQSGAAPIGASSSATWPAADSALGPTPTGPNTVVLPDSSGPAGLGASNAPPASTYQRLARAVTHNPVSQAVSTAVGRGTALVRGSARKVSLARSTGNSDLLSLARKTPPPRANLYVSLARLSEQAGNTEEAVAQYERALETEPGNLEAMLGYAHLLDRQGRFDEAIERYRSAVAKHPDSPTAHNDLALCYARSGRFDESIKALGRAVALKPHKELYRNNLATVLVEMGRTDEALAQLKEVHSEAIAHYNLAYLLQQRGYHAQAADQFAAALRINPQMEQAAASLARLGQQTPPALSGAAPANSAAQPTNVALSNTAAVAVPSSAPASPGLPQRPAYPESWRSQAAAGGSAHVPGLQSPQQAVLPPTPDTLDRYPTTAAPAGVDAY